MIAALILVAVFLAIWLLYPKQNDLASMTDDELRGKIDACHAIGANDAPYVAERARREQERKE